MCVCVCVPPCAPHGAPPRLNTGMLAQRRTAAQTAAPGAQRASLLPVRAVLQSGLPLYLCVTLIVANRSAAKCVIFSGPLRSGGSIPNALELTRPPCQVSPADRRRWSELLEPGRHDCVPAPSVVLCWCHFGCVVQDLVRPVFRWHVPEFGPLGRHCPDNCSSPTPKVLLSAGTRCSNSAQI